MNDTAPRPCPEALRAMARELLALADHVEVKGEATCARPPMPHLADHAARTHANRERRQAFLPPSLLGEPAWDMLLYLFVAAANGNAVRTSALAAASGAPASTALRHMELLQRHGLVCRSPSALDQRVTNVALSETGLAAMASYFARIASLTAADRRTPPRLSA